MSASDTAVQPSNQDVAQSSASPAAAADNPSRGVDEFLIARGGPFYDLQQRMGLLREHALRAGRRAAILVGLAWVVPLLLSAIAGDAIGPAASRPFLLDLGSWARFFIAIGIFVLMERLVEERLRVHLGQFVRAPLLAPGALPAAAEAVVRALRRRDLRLAEMVCVVAAYAITLGGTWLVLGAEASSWLVSVGSEGARLTPAGWWCVLVSSPLFWFLLLRWLWRHAVWGLLLRDLARLELRLVATHPDGAGGLAFIGQYPNAFAAFVFALSCVLGAAIARTLLQGALAPAAYGQLMAAWLVVVMILFGAPLLAFTKPLRRLKEATLLAASAIATRHQRATERELLGSNMSAAGIGVGKELGLLEFDTRAYGRIPDGQQLRALCEQHLIAKPIADAAPGDVLLLRFTRHPQHLAIVGDRGEPFSLIHAYADAGACVEHGADPKCSAASSPPTASSSPTDPWPSSLSPPPALPSARSRRPASTNARERCGPFPQGHSAAAAPTSSNTSKRSPEIGGASKGRRRRWTQSLGLASVWRVIIQRRFRRSPWLGIVAGSIWWTVPGGSSRRATGSGIRPSGGVWSRSEAPLNEAPPVVDHVERIGMPVGAGAFGRPIAIGRPRAGARRRAARRRRRRRVEEGGRDIAPGQPLLDRPEEIRVLVDPNHDHLEFRAGERCHRDRPDQLRARVKPADPKQGPILGRIHLRRYPDLPLFVEGVLDPDRVHLQDRARLGDQREREPVVAVTGDQVDQEHGREVTPVRPVGPDVDPVVLDLPPARVRRAGIAHPRGQDALGRPRRTARRHYGPGVDRVPVDVPTVVPFELQGDRAGFERGRVD
jgi:hypothetical protein